MDSFNDIKVYLWYSLIFLFLPVHELGHVIIARLIGETVTQMHWNYIMVIPNSFDFIHDWWEYSPFIASFCAILFAYLFLKDMKAKDIIFSKRASDAV
ncbi:MAG: hypothetical protein IMZ52_09995 [Actinobacteria bacterium]|nr:hypothetical protein [Actinomycetota bacterium]MBE3122106.1 hypothetical protein [Thermoplasmata archaeon]